MYSDQKKRPFLKTITNYRQTRNHPLNTSKSKNLYTFPKTIRFSHTNPSYNKNITSLKISTNFFNTKRSCSFGKGNKSDFTRSLNKTPAPNNYKQDHLTITKSSKKKKGTSFGFSREKCLIIGTIPLKKQALIPGVGSYNLKFLKSSKTCGFRIKTKKINPKNNENIGPGKYDINSTMGKNNSLFLSRFKNKGHAKINPLKSNKAKISNKINPTFLYESQFGINGTGKYFNSKFRDHKFMRFGRERRRGVGKGVQGPGPGNYLLPSDFGVYMSSSVGIGN